MSKTTAALVAWPQVPQIDAGLAEKRRAAAEETK